MVELELNKRLSLLLGATAAAAIAGVYYYTTSKPNEPSGGTLDAIGGHASKKLGPPMLTTADGKIWKPLQPPSKGEKKNRGEKEVAFYEDVIKRAHPVQQVIPKFYGLRQHSNGHRYMVLENMLNGIKKPCVIDLKMGTQTYDEEASPEKIAKESKKYPPQKTIGFKIVGMKVHRRAANDVYQSDRDWCLSLKPEHIAPALERYFFDGVSVRYSLVEKLIVKVQEIKDVLDQNPTWRFYGSSLLICYDGESAVDPDDIHVKMIDFAHVYPIKDGGKDKGYLQGLDFLLNSLHQILGNANDRNSGKFDSEFMKRNIKCSSEHISKVARDRKAFEQEVAFYRAAVETNDTITEYMPKLISVDEETCSMELTNGVTDVKDRHASPSERASVMDIELGLRSFDHTVDTKPSELYFNRYATLEKELEVQTVEQIWATLTGSKDGPQSLSQGALSQADYLSFKNGLTTSAIYGLSLRSLVDGDYVVTEQESREMGTILRFAECLERFLSDSTGFNVERAERYSKQLEKLLTIMEASSMLKTYEMVGSSLLFIHSGNNTTIKLIDFAGCSPHSVEDQNGLSHGVKNLRNILLELISKNTEPPQSMYY